MIEKIVVVASMGRLRAFALEEDRFSSTPRLRLLDEVETEVETKLSDHLTDQAGQFPKGSKSFSAISDMSNGERHNIELELKKRATRTLSGRMAELLEPEGVQSCYFAAGAPLHQQILEELSPKIRSKITKRLQANLAKVGESELMSHFKNAEPL